MAVGNLTVVQLLTVNVTILGKNQMDIIYLFPIFCNEHWSNGSAV
jgi:hypothetical protein